jgi:signal transduction histidine kinase
VIANLLNNAARYTPSGGVISLSISVDNEQRSAIVSVEDNGAGLSAEEMDSIFEPFVQGTYNETPFQGGLGIGLALARNLVEMHGGTITATSSGKGHGSMFCVRLPLP